MKFIRNKNKYISYRLMMFIIILLIIIIALTSFFSFNKKNKVKKDNTIFFPLRSEVQFNKILPLFSNGRVSNYIFSTALFCDLVGYDNNKKPIPYLVEEIPTFDNKGIIKKNNIIRVKWKLRNVFWSDGQPITTKDILFSYNVLRNPKIQHQIIDLTKYHVNNILKINIIDDKKFEVIFNKNSNYFILPNKILPAHKLKNIFNQNPSDLINSVKVLNNIVSSGPYYIEKIDSDKGIYHLTQNRFFIKKVLTPNIVFKVYRDPNKPIIDFINGDLDILPNLSVEKFRSLKKYYMGKYKFVKNSSLAVTSMLLNVDRIPDVNIRKAIYYAIDRDKILNNIFYNLYKKANNFMPLYHHNYLDNTNYYYDKEKAISLLNKSGWHLNKDKLMSKDNKILTINIVSGNNRAECKRMITFIKSYLNEVGIEVNTRVEFSNVFWSNLIKRNYDIAVINWYFSLLENGLYLFSKKYIPNYKNNYQGVNFSGYNNVNVEKIIEEFSRFLTKEQKIVLLKRYQHIILNDLPVIPLYYKYEFSVLKSNFKNWAPLDYMRSTWNIYDWVLE